ncbi:Protein of unknown function [Pyronema omphalodes CBS 100304]|uniref:Uncharacterized protein n=1 Tax=Pyronema omphalodes (strain CBS 100304) TaxID=1076935 RepID=U4LNN1_PYROM|nr:Protein of unknown function [Pyronema omphalodes CBS 100304]
MRCTNLMVQAKDLALPLAASRNRLGVQFQDTFIVSPSRLPEKQSYNCTSAPIEHETSYSWANYCSGPLMPPDNGACGLNHGIPIFVRRLCQWSSLFHGFASLLFLLQIPGVVCAPMPTDSTGGVPNAAAAQNGGFSEPDKWNVSLNAVAVLLTFVTFLTGLPCWNNRKACGFGPSAWENIVRQDSPASGSPQDIYICNGTVSFGHNGNNDSG